MSLNKCALKLSGLSVRILHVRWNTSSTVSLNKQVVLAHLHVEESMISPVITPRVATNPVLLSSLCINTITNNRNLMVNFRRAV